MASLVSIFGPSRWPDPAEFVIVELDDFGRPAAGGARALQVFPGEISDSQAVAYAQKMPPGAVLPVYQWTGGGERTISFTTAFARDTIGPDRGEYQVDVAAAVEWLRGLKMPRYVNGLVKPPPVLQIVAGRIGLIEGRPWLYAVLTEAGVTWKAFFHDGTPRVAEVSLTFTEVPQVPGQSVTYHGRESQLYTEAAKRFNRFPKRR